MLELNPELLHKQVVARTGPGYLQGEGEVIAYCTAPQVLIRRPDGSAFWWRADLCTIAPQTDTIKEPPHADRH